MAAPWGSAVEVALGLARRPAPAPTPLVPGGFLTAGQGFGHAVVGTTAFDESVRFATEGLGMVQSDWLETELAPGIDAGGPLLPLQRPPPHPRPGPGAVRAAPGASTT